MGQKSVRSSGVNIVEYDYLGLQNTAVVDYAQPDVQLDRTVSNDGKRRSVGVSTQAAGTYPGLDRFGRVIRHTWVDGGYTTGVGSFPNQPPILEETHTYDRASNRLSRVDARPGASLADRDFTFEYDGLDRLTQSLRGVWNPGTQTLSSYAAGGHKWDLDMLGNWSKLQTDANGSGTRRRPEA